jgi:hypothetical protein
MIRPITPTPLDDCGLVSPAMASRLTGLRPFQLRNLILDEGPVVRSIRVGGRFLIRLDDVLLAAPALAEGTRTP